MTFRASLAGSVTGAVLGGIGRAAVSAAHLSEVSWDTASAILAAAVVGIILGALAGLPGAPLLGAIVGAALSAVAYFGTLPIVLLFHALGTLSAPSLLEVVGVGAVAGALGGVAGRIAARRRSPDTQNAQEVN